MSAAAPEAFVPLNGSPGNSAPVTGGRRRKLKLVTRKQARKLLKKLGKKMRGGAPTDPVVVPGDAEKDANMAAGRRRRGTKKTHRRSRRQLFGLKY
jgi:hypothetical protein